MELEERDVARLWAKVDKRGPKILPTRCWVWTAALDHGYGVFTMRINKRGRNFRAHRVVYELVVGPISDGLQLDHLCRHHACVRPSHLEPVTPRVNLARGVGSKHGGHSKNSPTCVHGHLWTEESTRITNGGVRQCRVCDRERAEKRRRADGGRPMAETRRNVCKRGHPRTPDSVYRGGQCKQCVKDAAWHGLTAEERSAYNARRRAKYAATK